MNEYSSDTKKVAAKLAGMTEACANVHDDERLSELFALAPEGATHVDAVATNAEYLKRILGDEFYCLDGGEWLDCMLPENIIRRLVEIPHRERELNRLADDPEMTMGKVNQWTYAGYTFTPEQWQTRRQQRIAAGLIDVNDTDVIDIQDSQQDEVSAPAFYEASSDDPTLKPVFIGVDMAKSDTTEDNQPDWDSAPEGATHFDKNSELFAKYTHDNEWRFWMPNLKLWLTKDQSKMDYQTMQLTSRPEQSKSTEPASEQEWVNGLPPVGAECEIAASTEYLKISYEEGRIVKIYSHFTDDFGCELAAFVSVDHPRIGGVMTGRCFRPIKSAEEKRRDSMISDMAKVMFEAGANIGEPGAINDTTLGELYDWLVSTNRLTEQED